MIKKRRRTIKVDALIWDQTQAILNLVREYHIKGLSDPRVSHLIRTRVNEMDLAGLAERKPYGRG